MNRFGFILFPERDTGQEFFFRDTVGIVVNANHADNSKPPAAVWFETVGRRDSAMQEASHAWPGSLFCPVEVVSGIKRPAGPVTAYTINERGVLPQ